MRYTDNSNIHSAALDAKNRMRSGFWNTESIRSDPVKFATQKSVYGELLTFASFGIDVERLFNVAYSIITDTERILNPLGRMIEREIYENMTYEQKQRYVLKLSRLLYSIKQSYLQNSALQRRN